MTMPSQQFYEFGPFRLDPAERQLLRDGRPVPLTPKAFDTLLYFVENNNRLLSKEELITKIWPDSFAEESNLAQNVSTLRRTLGERTDGKSYIETVPKRGYRFIVEVRLKRQQQPSPIFVEAQYPSPAVKRSSGNRSDAGYEDGANADTMPFATPLALNHPIAKIPLDEPAIAARDTQPFPKTRQRFGMTAAVVLVALIIISASGLYFLLRSSALLRRSDKPHIAVLPFRNLQPNPDTDFLGFSLADAVITKLNYINSITVRPSAYVDKYRNQQVEPQTVADELNVDKLLMGTYLKEDNDLRVNIQLVDVAANRVLWSEPLNLKYEKLLTIQDRVTEEVARRLSVTLTPAESERIRRGAPQSPLAYEYHLRGVDLYHQDNLLTASKVLEKSVEIDPNYALSWAYLGTIYTTYGSIHFGGRQSYDKAQNAYDKALSIDPAQIETRIFKAAFLTDTGRVEQAVPLLHGVLETNPDLAPAHWELAYAYRFGGLLKESIAEGERARQIDNEIKANNSVFNSYFYNGQYDKFLQSLPPGENSAFITFYRGLGYYYLKDFKRAVAFFDRAYEMNSSMMPAQAGKALSYALSEQHQQGLTLLKGVEKKIVDSGVADAEGIYKIAQAFSVLGDKQSALRLLRHSVEGGFFCYPYFVHDALLANLRGEPEFTALMETSRRRHEEFKQNFSSP